MRKDLADELNVSQEGLVLSSLVKMEAIVPTNIAPNTALTASTTFYGYLGRAPKGCELVEGTIRSEAKGVGATTTLDVLKVPSGTAVGSGTAIVTQIATNGLTNATDEKLAPTTDGTQILAAGDSVFVKIVTQGSEVLKPVSVSLKFRP